MGNYLADASDFVGGKAFDVAKLGAVVGGVGVATGNPVAASGGAALLDTSAALGEISGGLQFAGGALQSYGGGNGAQNIIAPLVSAGLGVVVSKALSATIPRGWHGATLNSARASNRVIGNIMGQLTNLVDFFTPQQSKCP